MLFAEECEPGYSSSELEEEEEELRKWDAKKEFSAFFSVDREASVSSEEDEEEEVERKPKSMKCPRTLYLTPLEAMRHRITTMLQERERQRVEEGTLVEERDLLVRGRALFHNRISQMRPSPLNRNYDEELRLYKERKELISGENQRLIEQMAARIAIAEEKGIMIHPLHRHSRLPQIVESMAQESSTLEPVPPLALDAMLRHLNGVRILMRRARGELLLRTISQGEFYIMIALEAQTKTVQAYIIIRSRMLRM